jgi:HEAT repeat protein
MSLSDRFAFFRAGVRAPLLLIACALFVAWGVFAYWEFATNDDPVRLIRSRNVKDRRSAAVNLRVLTKKTNLAATTAALAHALRDQDEDVRILAAWSVGQVLSQLRLQPDVTPAEKKLLGTHAEISLGLLAGALSSDPSAQVRTAAVEGMAAIGTPRSTKPPPALAAAVKDGSVVWNLATIREYYGLREATPPPPLISALNDSSPEVRAKAVTVLGQFPLNLDPLIPDLLSRMANDDAMVRKECALTLHSAHPTVAMVPTLVDALADPHSEIRSVAAYLLGGMGSEAEAAVPALLEMLKEPVQRVAEQSEPSQAATESPCYVAARALGKIAKTDEVVAALAGLLASDDVEKVVAAANGLVDIGNQAVSALPALIAAYDRALKVDDPFPLFSSVSHALGRLAPTSPFATEVIDRFIRSLDSKNTGVRYDGVWELANFGPNAAAALPKLATLADDSDHSVRRAVAAARRAIDPAARADATAQEHN